MTSTQIDHIVLLISAPFFKEPPACLTFYFTITPGVYHNGPVSRNKLINFVYGTHLELFNWYDTPPPLEDEKLFHEIPRPETRRIDSFRAAVYNRVPAEEYIDTVKHRLTQEQDRVGLASSFRNLLPISQESGWLGGKVETHTILFSEWREDTESKSLPGTLRVASDDKAKTTHRCGVTGIAVHEILVLQNLLAEHFTLYPKILSSKPEAAGHDAGGKPYTLDFGVPQVARRAKVMVHEARREKELKKMQERGVG